MSETISEGRHFIFSPQYFSSFSTSWYCKYLLENSLTLTGGGGGGGNVQEAVTGSI